MRNQYYCCRVLLLSSESNQALSREPEPMLQCFKAQQPAAVAHGQQEISNCQTPKLLLLHGVPPFPPLKVVVVQQLLNQIDVSHDHPSAAVSVQAQGIQGIPVVQKLFEA